MTEGMNRVELTLLLSLGAATVARTGRLSTEARYRDVTPDEMRAIGVQVEHLLTPVIIGLREAGPPVTLEEIAQVTDEVARGALVAILGRPPAESIH